jgi:oxygen-independent coproporphyrinogen III oxidase
MAARADVLRLCDRAGPRYTSYPTAPNFTPQFGVAQLLECAERSNARGGSRPLSLYVHVPFCRSPCFYCGCNRIITRDGRRGERYVDRLLREVRLLAPLFDRNREIIQLHLGGGTPNFLARDTLERLISGVARHFRLSRSAERDFSIELDPRSVSEDYARTLGELGFNRVSLGVQDFDPEVQRAINRMQSTEQTFSLIDACRDAGVRSVNIDLIYGLPRQTPAAFRHTLRMVMSARPDRLAVYGYAHLPEQFKAQRHIDAASLPGPEARLELLRLAIEELSAAGYRYVGMDHFALPSDDLLRAQQAGDLHRNFMGYTTHAECDLVGVGVSAISHIGGSFSQNFRELKHWEAAIDAGRLPLWRGLELSADDRLRGAVIGQLMCQGRIDVCAIESRYGVNFASYFRDALVQLQPLVADRLVRVERERIAATAAGRLLLRSIAMPFDAYLGGPGRRSQAPFSRIV